MDFRFFCNARPGNYCYNLEQFGNKMLKIRSYDTHRSSENEQNIQSFLLPWQSTKVVILGVRLVTLVRMLPVSTIVATVVRVELCQ